MEQKVHLLSSNHIFTSFSTDLITKRIICTFIFLLNEKYIISISFAPIIKADRNKGDCENGFGLYFWPDGSSTNGPWKNGSPRYGGNTKTDVYDGKLIKSFNGEMEMGLVNGWVQKQFMIQWVIY